MYKSWFVCFIEQRSATLLIDCFIYMWQILVDRDSQKLNKRLRSWTVICVIGIFRPRWFVSNWDKKSIWSFARVVRRDQVIRARHVDHTATTCDMFVYSIVKITRLHDYQTWPTHNCFRNSRVRKGFWAFSFLMFFSDADWLSRQTLITWIAG